MTPEGPADYLIKLCADPDAGPRKEYKSCAYEHPGWDLKMEVHIDDRLKAALDACPTGEDLPWSLPQEDDAAVRGLPRTEERREERNRGESSPRTSNDMTPQNRGESSPRTGNDMTPPQDVTDYLLKAALGACAPGEDLPALWRNKQGADESDDYFISSDPAEWGTTSSLAIDPILRSRHVRRLRKAAASGVT
jgi:hypothetical protein